MVTIILSKKLFLNRGDVLVIETEKKIFYWEIICLFWIIIIGSLLHFTYDWSGKSTLVAMISPINESVWEHLKLGYWSLFFFLLIEYRYIKDQVQGFFFAKLSGILAMEVFIVTFFYSYTAIMGHHILWLDIASYILGAVICQFISFQLLRKAIDSEINRYSGLIFIMIGIIFIIFTFYPPDLPIFVE